MPAASGSGTLDRLRETRPGAVDLLALRRQLGVALAPALLQSAGLGPQGRYDILPLVSGAPLAVPDPADPGYAAALEPFRAALAAIDMAPGNPTDDLPFGGGWLIYLGYDFASALEPGVGAPRSSGLRDPLALLWRAPAALVFDHETASLHLLAEAGFEPLLEPPRDALRTMRSWTLDAMPTFALEEDAPAQFLDGVARIHEYLRAGDVFQVNLSRQWRALASAPVAPDVVYAALCRANPAPFAAILEYADWALLSSSPERLVRTRGDRIDTRPIAGTRRRDADPDIDAQLLAELRGDPKERAEHIMLIDLERNDLGRVACTGSVEVDEMGVIESYTHVHHLVSNVRARLRPPVSLEDLLRALFPGGTITGCPKIRCMQIIAELESEGRGAYTGSLGYIGSDGRSDLNILIRSISMRGSELQLRAGAGIVADSRAPAELGETRAKARGLLRALGAQA